MGATLLVLLLLVLLVWRGRARRDRLFVEQTSVHPAAGLGVYAGQLIRRGEVVAPYPGTVVSHDHQDRLFAALTSNAEHALRGEKVLFSARVLRLLHHFVVTGDKVNWPQILKAAQSYRFGFPADDGAGGEQVLYLLWMNFDGASGRAIFDVHNEATFGALINEPPPPAVFWNRVWGRLQRSEANVQARNVPAGVELAALRDIEPGEELLFCYGPFYFLRDYPIRDEACPKSLWGVT